MPETLDSQLLSRFSGGRTSCPSMCFALWRCNELVNKWNAGEWTDKETLMTVSVNQHDKSIERLSLVKLVMLNVCLNVVSNGLRCCDSRGLARCNAAQPEWGVISQCNYDLQCQLSWLVWSCSLSWEGDWVDCWGGDQVCRAMESRICVSQLITGNFVIPKAQCNCQFFL